MFEVQLWLTELHPGTYSVMSSVKSKIVFYLIHQCAQPFAIIATLLIVESIKTI